MRGQKRTSRPNANWRRTWEGRCIGVGAISGSAAGIRLAGYGIDLSSLDKAEIYITCDSLTGRECMQRQNFTI